MSLDPKALKEIQMLHLSAVVGALVNAHPDPQSAKVRKWEKYPFSAGGFQPFGGFGDMAKNKRYTVEYRWQ